MLEYLEKQNVLTQLSVITSMLKLCYFNRALLPILSSLEITNSDVICDNFLNG